MAYPFTKMTRLGEFKERAVRDFGCEIQDLPFALVGPDGRTVPQALIATGGTNFVVLPLDLAEDDTLSPTVLRNLCRRLGIDISEFGFHLG